MSYDAIVWAIAVPGMIACLLALAGCTCGPYYATDPIYDQELRFPQRVVWLHIEGQCKVQL